MAAAFASLPTKEETGHNPVSSKLVATGVSELIVGRKLQFPIYGDNDELLLAAGVTITPQFAQRLKQRQVRSVKVHSDDLAQATFRPSEATQTRGLELDAAVAQRIDAIIDDGLLLVGNSESAVLMQMTWNGKTGYNRQRYLDRINRSKETSVFVDNLMHNALQGKTIDSGEVTRLTAGFLNEKPQRELMRVVDAATIDLKGNDAFYEKYVLAKLKPVQDYIRIARQEKVFIEIVNLIVPTLNDRDEDIAWLLEWILGEAGPDVPLHFLRFSPMYKLANLYPTPAETMLHAARRAVDMGMHYVYVGNLPTDEFEHTRCPKCREVVIRRQGYRVPEVTLRNGRCPKCGERIPGTFLDA
jgi:hypothetical protein